MAILVTGGAGFIGSHTSVELLNKGKEIVIIDNFSNSKPEVLDKIKKITGKDFKFYEIDYLDKEKLERVFEENKIEAVMNFAGYKSVGESVKKPLEYYENNNQEISFSYEGVNYFVHQLPKIDENTKIGVLDSDVEITLEELFLLIYLIQDKSNYLISLGKKTEYINGIIRMLKTLLKCNNKNDVLETIGWLFDHEKCYYILNSKDFLSEKKKRMNYLTEYEESLIL